MLSKQERENIEKNLDILGVTNEWKNELDNIKEELSSYDKEELYSPEGKKKTKELQT